MKFNVEIEIGWIDREGRIDEEVLSQVQSKLVDKIYQTVERQVLAQAKDIVDTTLSLKIMQTYDEFLEKKFTVYDRWGDIQRESVSVKELLKEKLDAFMTEKVDEAGKSNSYNGKPRYMQILDVESQKQINSFISSISSEVIEGIKNDINDQAVDRISKSILSDYSLKKLINPIA